MRTGLLLAGSWVSDGVLPMLPGPVSVYMDVWCQGHDVWLPPSAQTGQG